MLLFSSPVDNYVYDFRTKQHRLLIKNAWGGAISPDREKLAYVTPGPNLGDTNLWIFDFSNNSSYKLTNFQNVDINGSWVTWSFDSQMICFGWTEAKELKDYFWTINPDGALMQNQNSLSPCLKKNIIKMSESSFNAL